MSQKNKFKQTEIGMIPEDWEVTEFINLLTEKTRNGIYKTKEFHGSGIKVINMKELFAYPRIGDQEMKRVELNNSEKSRFLVQEGDLIFARRSLVAEGSGKCSLIVNHSEPLTFESSIILARPNKKIVDSEYLYYFFSSPKGSQVMGAILRQVAVSGITGTDLMKLKIVKPSLLEQSAIASILSDLDFKIELNQQMNKTLEAIGQALFKHWFVDFEFPNEKGKPYKSSGGEMVESELGEIPKGWRVSKIGTEFETILGGTPSTINKSYWENGIIAWINSGEINKFRITEPTAYITKEAVDNSATKLMPKGTTVLAITGATLGQVSRIEINTCANQSVIGIIENKDIPSEYIYLWIKHKIMGLISHQTGGAQQHINKNNVNELEILLPDDSVMLKFKEMIGTIFKNISINCFESQNLSQIRDSLLPRLMSGKIRVPVEAQA